MRRTLKNNGIVGLLIDQNSSRQEGVFVDFFGRPACTTDGLALLALHTEAPVIPAFMVRLEDGRYRLVFGEEIKIINTDQREQDVLINTQNFTRVIEEMIGREEDHCFVVDAEGRLTGIISTIDVTRLLMRYYTHA